MNAITFNKIPTNKTEQTLLANKVKNLIKEGEIDPLKAAVQLKSMSEVITSVLKDSVLVDSVVNECGKYGKGENPGFAGAGVSVRETGVKYDFTVCDDPVWNDLNKQLSDIKEAMKERETYLKAITSKKPEIDPETGEIYEIKPPVRTSTTTFAVTFKKE